MIKNYFKIGFRNILLNKTFSLINVLGLAIGIASCIIIFLFVDDELKYDKFTSDNDRIFRVLRESVNNNQQYMAINSGMLLPSIKEKIPEISDGVRVKRYFASVSYNDVAFNEKRLIVVDSNFFEFFDWEKIVGDISNAFKKEDAVIISKDIAQKYFGDDNPIGKVLEFNKKYKGVVRGVIEKSPKYSHIKADFILTLNFLKIINSSALTNWDNQSIYTYLLLEPNTNPEFVKEKIIEIVNKELSHSDESRISYGLQALKDIHLRSANIGWDITGQGNISNIYGFSAIAVLILLLACFNYMNLSTARSTLRAKEIGLRKTIGANRSKIIFQFLIESLIITVFAVTIAIISVEILLPLFNNIIGKSLTLYNFSGVNYLLIFIGLIILVSLMAGFYPAFVLSGFNASKILKGNVSTSSLQLFKKKGFQLRFRQILVVIQLATTVGLIIAAIMINIQLGYVRNKELGIQKEQLLSIENPWGKNRLTRYKNMKNKLLTSPNILGFSGASNVPGEDINTRTSIYMVGDNDDNGVNCALIGVDSEHFSVLEAEIIQGRDFIDNSLPEQNYCILNEAAAKAFNIYESSIDIKFEGFYDNSTKRNIGVVKDIHYKSLHEAVEPAVYFFSEEEYPYYFTKMLIRVEPENFASTISFINDSWKEIAPEWPIKLNFINDRFESMYSSDKRVSKIIDVFTCLALFISLLGLFGLVAFVVGSRTKEIGIRKVLGAKIYQIFKILSAEFIVLTILSNIIIWPVVYFIIERWLNNFVFTTNIKLWLFPMSGFLVFILVMLIVVFHVLKTTRANPVEALKCE